MKEQTFKGILKKVGITTLATTHTAFIALPGILSFGFAIASAVNDVRACELTEEVVSEFVLTDTFDDVVDKKVYFESKYRDKYVLDLAEQNNFKQEEIDKIGEYNKKVATYGAVSLTCLGVVGANAICGVIRDSQGKELVNQDLWDKVRFENYDKEEDLLKRKKKLEKKLEDDKKKQQEENKKVQDKINRCK